MKSPERGMVMSKKRPSVLQKAGWTLVMLGAAVAATEAWKKAKEKNRAERDEESENKEG